MPAIAIPGADPEGRPAERPVGGTLGGMDVAVVGLGGMGSRIAARLLGAGVTRELVTMAEVVVLASRAGRTTSPAAGRTAELLERLGAPTLGVVLVGVATGQGPDADIAAIDAFVEYAARGTTPAG